ncbi:MAG: hypothetical protein ACREUE_05690 [Panacagrimonas sp.]
MSVAADCAFGVAAGAAFGWLWTRVVPWTVHSNFWSTMTVLTRDSLKVEDARGLWVLYRSLIRAVACYVGRNLTGTLVASVPLVIVWLMAGPFRDASAIAFGVAFIVSMSLVCLWPNPKPS